MCRNKIFIVIIFFFCASLSSGGVRFPEKFEPMNRYKLNAEHLSFSKTRAADSLNCTLVGGCFMGPCLTACVVETLAYISAGAHIKILNVKDSTNPVFLGEVKLPYDAEYLTIRDIDVQDTLAYVADGPYGLRIINVADPSSPFEIGSYDTPYFAAKVWIQDTIAYIVDNDPPGDGDALLIINVTDPASPIEIGLYDTGYEYDDLWIQDTLAYIVGDSMRIINISDPTSPAHIGTYENFLSPYGCAIFVQDTLAYIGADSFFVINVSDPTSPFEIGSYVNWSNGNLVLDIVVQDNLAYLVISASSMNADSLVCIINVSNPASMSEIGRFYTPGRPTELYLKNNLAYASYMYDQFKFLDGLVIININDPSAPSEIGRYGMGGINREVRIKESLAYVANSSRGLRIINIADPSNSKEIGFFDPPGRDIDGVYIENTLAYILDADSVLRVIDISDPALPFEIDFYNTVNRLRDIWVKDTLAYIANSDSGLRIINVSNPSTMSEIGFCYTRGSAFDIYVKDTLAYVACDSGISIINVANSSSPGEIGFFYNSLGPYYDCDIWIQDTLAYLIDNDSLYIIDVSDPSSVSEISSYYILWANNLWVENNLAYVTCSDSTCLRIINVSDPFSPSEAGFYQDPNQRASGIYVKDSLIYVCHYNYGFYIIKYTGDLPNPFITVTVPNGGEIWQAGSNHNITWTSNGTSGNVQVEYSTDNGSNWSGLIASMPDTGSHPWMIPDNPSDSCLVRVSDTDGTPADISDAVFTIYTIVSNITVTSPNGGEDWRVDSTYDITWTSNGASGNVRIEYSTDNGSNWTELIASIPDTGSYPWMIPDNPSDSCLVRVSDTVGNPSDISDSIFTISTGSGVEDNQILKEEVSVLGFRPGIKIQYSLPKKEKVTVEIYNVLGQREQKLLDEIKPSGRYTIKWNGSNGIYFVRVEIGDRVYKEKAIILR